MLKAILESNLDLELKRLLLNVVETYFELDEERKGELRRLLATEEYRNMQDTEMTYFDKLEEQGREAGKRETLFRLLTVKFGPLSEGVVRRVNGLPAAELDAHLERLLTARSLEELQLEDRGARQK